MDGNSLVVSSDPSQIDREFLCRALPRQYWAGERTRDEILRSLDHSFCFSVLWEGRQIGFARVITDRATFAYLCDVFVLPEFQRRGVASHLMRRVLCEPGLQKVNWMLRTRDAHGFYERHGFLLSRRSERYMEKISV